MDDHKIPLTEFAERFKTDLEKGLTDQEVEARLEKDGPNKMTEHAGTHWSLKLFH